MELLDFTDKMINFISKETKNKNINMNTQLIGTGLVDSLLLTSLIIFVEDTLECDIDIDDFSLDNFNTIKTIYDTYA